MTMGIRFRLALILYYILGKNQDMISFGVHRELVPQV